MKINALLDVNVVAHETEDEVAVLLELTAPPAPVDAARRQASFQVVLDRSGSMNGQPLEGAKKALVELVRRLEPTDNFGLVTFDHSADVVVPAGPLTDKDAVVNLIEAVHSGGSTDLSSGYMRGLREIRRVADESGGTVLIISDGHVNAGLQKVEDFQSLTAKAYGDGIVTSTLGYGRGYDETLLAAIARSGSGNHVFAENPDAAAAAIAAEADGLLNKVAQAVALTVKFEPSVKFLRLYNDLPGHQIGDGTVMIELGDLYSEEHRMLLLKFKVPAMSALGLAKIASLELAYVELPTLVEHVATIPISVNVVPGDAAAGRVPHPTVRTEMLFQEAQQTKRKASEAFEMGDRATAKQNLGQTRQFLTDALTIAKDGARANIEAELSEVDKMDAMADAVETTVMSKLTRESYHLGTAKRGRDFPPSSFKGEADKTE